MLDKMERIVFFDIDGTLLNDQKELSESTQEAVYTLQKNGVHVAIATGRAPYMFTSLQEQLQIENHVSFNGQHALFDGEVIYKRPVPEAMLRRLEDDANRRNHPMVFMHLEDMTTQYEDHPLIEESIGALQVTTAK